MIFQVRQLADEVGISSDQGVTTMLQFYHDLGVLIYNPEPGALDAALQNMIILRPQWLVDVFKKIMLVNQADIEVSSWRKLSFSQNYGQFSNLIWIWYLIHEKMSRLMYAFIPLQFAPSWKRLQEQGILEDKLVNHLWAETLEQKPALLGLMEKFDLLCQENEQEGQVGHITINKKLTSKTHIV